MNLDSLEDFLKILDRIQGLSSIALVAFSCLVIGYILRFVKRFPNDAIPVVVVLWGAAAMMFVADGRPGTMKPHVWEARNVLIGLIVGAVCWAIHFIALRRLESWIGTKFPGASDTTLFAKDSNKQSDPTSKP